MELDAKTHREPSRPSLASWLWLVLAAIYLGVVLLTGYGEWLEKNPTPENLARGRRWVPADPVLWRMSGRSQVLSLQPDELRSSARSFEQSLDRDPFDAVAWDDLAAVASHLDNAAAQEHALRAAVIAVPHSPVAAWALANFLLQQGRQQEAFPFFRSAAGDDPGLRVPEFELGWKLLGDPQQILDDLVPEDLESRMKYLYYLGWTKGVVREAYPAWQKISSSRTDEVIELGQSYTEALAAAGFGEEAAQVWAEIWPQDAGEAPRTGGERVINGSFEKPLRNAGLDWRIMPGPGYQVTLDDFSAKDGGRSLRVQFDGSTNPEFGAVREWVPVEPGRDYHFQAYLKTDNLSSSSGMCLAIATVAAPVSEAWEKTTEGSVGTTPWTEEQLDFRTGPNTHVLLIALRRRQSEKLDNMLRGTAWLDSVSLTARPN